MNLSKKIILLGLVLIFIITSFTMFSFASEEKDYINRALKLIEEEEYNEAVRQLEEALSIVGSKADLEFVNVTFTDEEAWGFGMYNPRKNAVFAQGETFFIYGEAKNFTIKEIKKDLYEIYLKEDLYILDKNNNILFKQEDFLDYHITSHSKNSDLFITNTLTQTSPFPVGDYKFLLVLKDIFSGKTTEVTIEFTVSG
ncbi:MAG TPA: hypothetical protein DEG96_07160 [Candidatus Atribacteria bacterium]|nr:hypothetical protein [Candidatus Atribacteria bacterium]